MKILVLFTGGTIGSSVSENYIAPDQNAKYKLIKFYQEKFGKKVEFVCREPYTILSENLDGEYISKLIRSVKEGLLDDEFGGIIVTHGTDTLQYSAAALSIALGKTGIPIILVSANYPLEDERSNGFNNFIGAVQYIERVKKGGVYVSYQNGGGFANIFDGATLLKYDIYSDEIRPLGNRGKNSDCGLTQRKDNEIVTLDREVKLKKYSPVKMIVTYPGITFDIPEMEIEKILFVPYHSGTLPTDNENLKNFCIKMQNRGVKMYICGVPEGPQYETTKLYDELGIEVLGSGTDIYWYMKLWMEE
ncbi:MAG: hypothetical protein E7254_04835 [Lachnospiraceae bacterium]|nr:hypothetical protein [Lachnospiraceae bacterium]